MLQHCSTAVPSSTLIIFFQFSFLHLKQCELLTRYLLVECNEDKDTKEGAMYLNVMRRFSQVLMKVSCFLFLLLLSYKPYSKMASILLIFVCIQIIPSCLSLFKVKYSDF